MAVAPASPDRLYSIQFLHQITTFITSKKKRGGVVQYPISTSNHNEPPEDVIFNKVVQYPISTSNHNVRIDFINARDVVQYPISTSNHNSDRRYTRKFVLYSIQFLHQITTLLQIVFLACCCIVSNFYIKSQRTRDNQHPAQRCIVSNFYIKSQRLEAGLWS